MKVVIAHNLYSSAQPSGENEIVESESRQLAAAGVTVLPLLRHSDDIAALPATRKALLPFSPIYNAGAQRELAELIRRERPDVLHLHNPYPLLSPWVVRTAHRYGVPVVQTVHNYRHVCAAATYFRDGHPCHDCLGKRFPTPAIRHSCYRGSTAQSVVMATTLAVHRPTWRSVDRYVALAPHLADHLKTFGITDEQIAIKPNGIPDPGPLDDSTGDGFLFFGRLTPEKGVDLLLDAWQRHADGDAGTLRIAGDGPLRARVEAAAAARADVEYLGLVDHAEVVPGLVRAASVVVVPSTYADALPTVILEALASGRPVLGTNVGGTPYLLGLDPAHQPADPAPGWVVEPEPAALAEALAMARLRAAPLRPAARHRYQTAFAPDVLLRRLIELYEEVAADAATARAPQR